MTAGWLGLPRQWCGVGCRGQSAAIEQSAFALSGRGVKNPANIGRDQRHDRRGAAKIGVLVRRTLRRLLR